MPAETFSGAKSLVELIEKVSRQTNEKFYRGTFKKDLQGVKITSNNIAPNSIGVDRLVAQEFIAQAARIALAQIQVAEIDTAQIRQLEAYVANIAYLTVQNADIQWANIANLVTAIADITVATIQTATIGWANIGGIVADTLLFTQGVSGKLYCADLMVTDANIENLSANKIIGGMALLGKLMIYGQDGKIYEINVNELGEVISSERKLDDENIGDYTLVDRNIAEGTLTARTINVQDVFADSALIRNAIVQNLDVDALFAREAYITKLRTSLIQSDIGGYLQIESDTGVRTSVKDTVTDLQNSVSSVEMDMSTNMTLTSEAVNASAARITTVESALPGLASKMEVDAKFASYQLTADGFAVRINAAESVISELEGDSYDLKNFKNLQETAFKVTEEGATVGRTGVPTSVLVAPDRVAIRDQYNNEVTRITENNMEIENASIRKQLTVGFVARVKLADGSCGDKWIG